MRLISENDYDDFNSEDQVAVNVSQEVFADELFQLIQGLVDSRENDISETFLSVGALQRHFFKHCLGKVEKRRSKRNWVYYDFIDINDYKQYEEKISDKIMKSKYRIYSLLDVDSINKFMHKLFEGDIALLFTTSCGFDNDKGHIMVGVYSFSSNVTKNYMRQNTLDLAVYTPEGKCISIYPIDANHFQAKFNAILQKYAKYSSRLNFNH